MTRYEHTQIGHTIIWSMLGAAVFVAIIGALTPTGPGPSFIVEAILLSCAIAFYKLTVKIDNGTLRACFGPGLVCKRVPVAEIVECERIRIQWWYGWGIRLTPYGWLYNVSGWDAVAIRLRDGRRFALGTDDPDGLTEAIREHDSVK